MTDADWDDVLAREAHDRSEDDQAAVEVASREDDDDER